jgi:hypothetical protein
MTTQTITQHGRDTEIAEAAKARRDAEYDDALLEREISEFRAAGRPLDTNDINLLKEKYGKI